MSSKELENIADIRASLYEDVSEPTTFYDLVMRLNKTPFNFGDYLGNALNPNARVKAARILKEGKERIIGTFVGGVVNGFVFNPFHPDSVQTIVDIKSLGGNPRRPLFSCVATGDTVQQLVDNDLIRQSPFANLAGDCFILLPIQSKYVAKIPKELLSKDKEIPFVQFFIVQPNSWFEDLINKSAIDCPIPISAGTSANFTGYDSMTNRWQSALFCLGNGIFWLDLPGKENKNQRGSFPIVKFFDGELFLVREGNVPFELIKQRIAPDSG